jgi:ribosomal protein L30E
MTRFQATVFLKNEQIELGTACGKLFRCSTMAILDAGDSDILTGTQ